MLHHPYDSLHNVIHVGEVSLTVAVVEDLDLLPFQQLVGEAKVGHVGTTTRTINGEEAESCTGDIVQLGVARSKSVGRYHMMMGENPIYIISCSGRGEEPK